MKNETSQKITTKKIRAGEYVAEYKGHSIKVTSHRLFGKNTNIWNITIDGETGDAVFSKKKAIQDAVDFIDNL